MTCPSRARRYTAIGTIGWARPRQNFQSVRELYAAVGDELRIVNVDEFARACGDGAFSAQQLYSMSSHPALAKEVAAQFPHCVNRQQQNHADGTEGAKNGTEGTIDISAKLTKDSELAPVVPSEGSSEDEDEDVDEDEDEDKIGDTVLHMCARSGKRDAVAAWLSGERVFFTPIANSCGHSALHVAILKQQPQIVRQLMTNLSRDLNTVTVRGVSSVWRACVARA